MKRIIFFVLLLCFVSLSLQAQVLVRSDNDWGGFLSKPSDIDLGELRSKFRSDLDTVVMVHGFNNSPSGAKSSFQVCTSNLRKHIGERNYVGFYWPSNTLIDFGKAVSNANESGPYLVHVLGEISRWYGNSSRKIHIISHSLGGRVLLSTLKQNEIRFVKLGQCFSMAAAVHSNIYTKSFSKTNDAPERTWVYYSNGDGVLKYLYALYHWLFEMNIASDSDYDKFMSLTLDEKLKYMDELYKKHNNGVAPPSSFDQSLLEAIQRSSQDAMGLVGCKPLVGKVTNVEVTKFVNGHTYWSNSKMMELIGAKLR